jgi:hypothetical protein
MKRSANAVPGEQKWRSSLRRRTNCSQCNEHVVVLNQNVTHSYCFEYSCYDARARAPARVVVERDFVLAGLFGWCGREVGRDNVDKGVHWNGSVLSVGRIARRVADEAAGAHSADMQVFMQEDAGGQKRAFPDLIS